MAGACRRGGSAAPLQRCIRHKVPLLGLNPKEKIAAEHFGTATVHAQVSRRIAMFAEIQKLEAAARMAMGSFESPGIIATSAKQRSLLPYLAYALVSLAVIGLAITLL